MSKKIGIFDIVSMNIVTLLGIRWFATAAQYGASSIILWILAALLYFVPMSFIFAELSSIFPESKGGLVDWLREIFGEKFAFISGWFYLLCNIFYFPTILTFAAVTCAYLVNPMLAQNKTYVTSFIIIGFILATAINLKGVKWISFFGKIGGLIGNIVPIIVLIIVAIIAIVFFKLPVATNYSLHSLMPSFNSDNLLFLATLTFAMSGGEITSPFVTYLKNPKKDFAKATLISAVLITVLYIVGTISMTLVLSPSQIGAASGPINVIYQASSKIGLEWITDVIAILITIAMFAGTIIWLVGNIKMFIEGNDQKYIPKILRKENRDGIPVNALIAQTIVVVLIVLTSSLMKSVENLYMILVMMATIPMFIVYLILIIGYFKLKIKMQKNGKYIGSYTAPWGKFGVILFTVIAFISTLATIIIPIFSPGANNVYIYEAEVIGGPIIFLIIALIWIKIAYKKKNQAKN